jgi:hypothetical protein
MNPNMRKVVRVEENGKGQEGVVMTCGHWQKMPHGVVSDYSNATYRAFAHGERFVSCQTCAKARREQMKTNQ